MTYEARKSLIDTTASHLEGKLPLWVIGLKVDAAVCEDNSGFSAVARVAHMSARELTAQRHILTPTGDGH